ncbi:MAG: winged helix-turn-helix domain-containing protein [Xanthomonadales bacterium]|nr:winged helix-turn-helix domain-containing protein [Xanthomonadales bacterium]
MTHAPTEYRFRDWRYVPETRRLIGVSGETRLKPLSDRLLRQLLDAPGSVLAREHLIATVWTRREVNDEVLSRAVAELRAVLGDDAREPRYVETLPKGGYRWIAPIERDAIAPPSAIDATGAGADGRMHGRRMRLRIVIFIGALAAAVAITLATIRTSGDAPSRERLAAHLLGARPLAVDPRLEFDPRFDPSGRVAYVRAPAAGGANELVLADPASAAERVLWRDDASLRKPAPSPDGREIAVQRLTAAGCEVWSIALVDLRRTRLDACAPGSVSGLEWVDGGNGLIHGAAAIDGAHAPGLVLLDRRDGSRRVLTTPTAAEGAHVDPRVSSDGTRIAYAARHGGEGRLWSADWPGLGARRALLKRAEPISGHAFEPGGYDLWVAGDLTRYRALHRLRLGGEPELIGGRGALSIDLAPDGSAVWAEAAYDADIHIGTAANPQWATIARSNRYESQPEFSHDAQRLALVSNRSGTESIIVVDRDGGRERALVLDAALRWVRPTWSAREDALILTAYEDSGTRLYRFRLDGDRPEVLAGLGDDAFHGTELADRIVFLRGHGSARSTLVQQRAGTGTIEDLGLGRVAAYRASAGWLAWISADDLRLRVAPWPRLSPVREIALTVAGAGESLALAGDVLAYADGGAVRLLTLPDGEPVAVVGAPTPGGNGPNLAIAADGTIAIVAMTSVNIDLMIAAAAAR